MSNKQIVKTENCPGCLHCAQNYVEDDELVIMCDLELEGYEEVDGEKCKYYTTSASKMDDELVDEGGQDSIVAFGSDHTKSGFGGGRKVVTAKIRTYIFVGDKLSEVKKPIEGMEVVELDAAFAIAWNLQIDQAKEDLAKDMEVLEANHVEKLEAAKAGLVGGEYVTIEELFVDEGADDLGDDEDDEEEWEDDELDGDGPEFEDEADEEPVKPVVKKPAKKTPVKKPVAKKPASKKKAKK